jgi:Domain of unknown function (DUF6875)
VSTRLRQAPNEEAAEIERSFWRWVGEYVTQPHAELGREGAVCPFVGRLVDSGNLHVEIDLTVSGADADAIEARMRTALEAYEAMPNADRKAVVVVFANVVGPDVAVVDRVQAALKDELVPKGLMVGQFHPLSTEGGARNPDFLANRAPFAAIALRPMSHHDIVFLDRSPEMFREYESRFGHEYASGRDIDPFLVERYNAAAARFGATPAPDGG